MKNRLLIILVVIMTLSVTSNMVHVLTPHENTSCDHCLHIQSNDAADISSDPFYELSEYCKNVNQPHWHKRITQYGIDEGHLIRGPPSAIYNS